MILKPTKNPLFLSFSLIFLCFSCGGSSESVPTASSEETPAKPTYHLINPDNIEATYQTVMDFNDEPVLPSTGDNNVLIVPVEFSDYPFPANFEAGIQSAFMDEANSYFESVASYYRKSSYGKLQLDFEIAPILEVGKVDDFVLASYLRYMAYGLQGYELVPEVAMEKAVSEYKKANGEQSLKKFDNDHNGVIDSIVMVYSCPTYAQEPSFSAYGGLFWNFCYRSFDELTRDEENPCDFRYMWMSYSSLFNATSMEEGVADAHTAIHEMGHLFGLSDFYNSAASEGETGEPSGRLTMMSHSVLDHDIYAKIALGWANPKVILDEGEIDLEASYKAGDCLILSDIYNGSGFDEFIVMELFAPKGLNELDSKTPYLEWEGVKTGYSLPGVRVYHVDSRLVYGVGYTGSNVRFQGENYLSDQEVENFSSFDKKTITYGGKPCKTMISLANTNSKKYDSSVSFGAGFEEVSLIQAGKKNTLAADKWSSEKDLFQEGDRFSIADYQEFFVRKGKLNNGNALSYSCSIISLSEESAKIRVSKI